MPESPGQPKEGWPLPWVAASIAVFVIGYTFISLEYRKVNRPYEPYHDLKERGQTHTLLEAGYQRIPLTVATPTSGDATPAPLVVPTPAPAGVPPYLAKLLFDPPRLPAAYTALHAAPQVPEGRPYIIDFDCQPGGGRKVPGTASAYVHADTIVIVPECEEGDADQPGSETTRVRLTLQGGELKRGHYEVRLIGTQSSLGWPLQVN